MKQEKCFSDVALIICSMQEQAAGSDIEMI